MSCGKTAGTDGISLIKKVEKEEIADNKNIYNGATHFQPMENGLNMPRQHGNRGGNQSQRVHSSPGQRGGGQHSARGGAGQTGSLTPQHGNRGGNQSQRVHSSPGQRGSGQHSTRGGAGQTGMFPLEHGNQSQGVHSSPGQRGGGQHGTRGGAGQTGMFPLQHGNQSQRAHSSLGQRGGGQLGTRGGAGQTGILSHQHGNIGGNQSQRFHSSPGQRRGGQHGTRGGAGQTGILPQQHGNTGGNQNQRVHSSLGQRGGGQHSTGVGAGQTGILPQQHSNLIWRVHSSSGQRGGGQHGTRGGAGQTGILPQQHGNRGGNQSQRFHISPGQRGGDQHSTRGGQTGIFPQQQGNRGGSNSRRGHSSQDQRRGGHQSTRGGGKHVITERNWSGHHNQADFGQPNSLLGMMSTGQRKMLPQQFSQNSLLQLPPGLGITINLNIHQNQRKGRGMRKGSANRNCHRLKKRHNGAVMRQYPIASRSWSSSGEKEGHRYNRFHGQNKRQGNDRGRGRGRGRQQGQGERRVGNIYGACGGESISEDGSEWESEEDDENEEEYLDLKDTCTYSSNQQAGQTGILPQQHGNRGGNQSQRFHISPGQRGGGQHGTRGGGGQTGILPQQQGNRGGSKSQRGHSSQDQRRGDRQSTRGGGNHVISERNWSGHHNQADFGQLNCLLGMMSTGQRKMLPQQFSQNSLLQLPPGLGVTTNLNIHQNQQKGRGMRKGSANRNCHRLKKRHNGAVMRQYPFDSRPWSTSGEKEGHRYNKFHGQNKRQGNDSGRGRGRGRQQGQGERRVGNIYGACGGESISEDGSEWESEEDDENEEEYLDLKDTCIYSSNQQDSILEMDAAQSSPICDRFLVDNCKMTGCKYHHIDSIKLPYIWQIKMPQSWLTLDKQQIIEAERAYCNRADTCQAVIFYGGRNYFATLEFHNPDTLTAVLVMESGNCIQTSVRRLSTVSYTKGYKPSAEDSFKTQWRWFYTNDFGNWLLFEPELLQFTLEQKFSSKCQDTYLFFRENYQLKYRIDFKSMNQINMETGEEWKLLRRPLFVSAEDVELKRPEKIVIKTGVGVPLPKAWVPWDLAHPFELVELKQNSTEFKKVEHSFFTTLHPQEFYISYIFRVQNMELWISYCGQKKSMKISLERAGQTKEVDERNLFHGTDSLDTTQGICTNNFDFRLCGKHGTVYGKGAYFAQHAQYSHGYTDNSNTTAVRYMFLAKVLLGEYTVGSSSYTRPPEKSGDTAHQLFDSCVDSVDNPSIFVVFDLKQCYPEYLICYKRLEEFPTEEVTSFWSDTDATPLVAQIRPGPLQDQSAYIK